MSMNGDRNYTGAAGKLSDHWRSNCFLKIDTEGAKTRCAGCILPQSYFQSPSLCSQWPDLYVVVQATCGHLYQSTLCNYERCLEPVLNNWRHWVDFKPTSVEHWAPTFPRFACQKSMCMYGVKFDKPRNTCVFVCYRILAWMIFLFYQDLKGTHF